MALNFSFSFYTCKKDQETENSLTRSESNSFHIVLYYFLNYGSSCVGVFPSYRSIVIRLWKDQPWFFNAIYCISHAAQHGEHLSLTSNTFISHSLKQKEYWVSALWDTGELGSVNRIVPSLVKGPRLCIDLTVLASGLVWIFPGLSFL